MRVQVVIIGAGPAGLLLAERLRRADVEALVLEKHTAEHVLARIRAGVIEDGAVRQLRELGVAGRLDAEGLVHDGLDIAFAGERRRIDLAGLTGRHVTVYGQTEITRDLMQARAAAGGRTVYEARDVTPLDFAGARPRVAYRTGGRSVEVACDFVVGADGHHGAARASLPAGAVRAYERAYPYGWLGLLADVRPVSEELIYVNHDRGFALCSMRSPTRSRYYLQVPAGTDPAAWTAGAFFDELRRRLPPPTADAVETGPALEVSVAALRCFVAEPLSFGRLFLVGDAGHIVPPTGAKGLNLAASDAFYLAEAMTEFYCDGSTAGLDGYSERALARVWRSVRFSQRLTALTHADPAASPFDRRIQQADLAASVAGGAETLALAESYVGPPY